jgi:hypothetical protein
MTATAHASTAAEAIRTLNHATLPGGSDDSLKYPADVHDIIGSLDQLAAGLPQALGQVWTFLSGLAGDGYLRSDRNSLDRDLSDTHAALDDAVRAAHSLTGALGRAHSATSHLAYNDDRPDDEPAPCGESGCLCYCPGGHVCGCDCPRCPDCQQHPEYCDCDE